MKKNVDNRTRRSHTAELAEETAAASGHSTPLQRNERTMPVRFHTASQYEVSVYSQSRAPIKCCIAAAMLSECYEPSPAPVPPLRTLSHPYISPSEDLPKMPLTTDLPLWPSLPYNGFSPAPCLTIASAKTAALGLPLGWSGSHYQRRPSAFNAC